MPINVTFVPNVKSTPSEATMPTLDKIPDEVKQVVNEVYEALKTNPGRMRVGFSTVQELNQFIADAKAYCQLRPEGKLHFRRSPSARRSSVNPDGLAPTEMEFRITDPPQNGTEEIREAVDAVKQAAKK